MSNHTKIALFALCFVGLKACSSPAGVAFGAILAVPVVGMSVCANPGDAAIGSIC